MLHSTEWAGTARVEVRQHSSRHFEDGSWKGSASAQIPALHGFIVVRQICRLHPPYFPSNMGTRTRCNPCRHCSTRARWCCAKTAKLAWTGNALELTNSQSTPVSLRRTLRFIDKEETGRGSAATCCHMGAAAGWCCRGQRRSQHTPESCGGHWIGDMASRAL